MSETKRTVRIKLNDILNDIDHDALSSFIYRYARQDKSFEIALKSHFISKFQTGNPDSKYAKILSEIIKPRTLSNPKISANRKKLIIIVLKDLSFQMEDLLSTESYMEAFYISKNALDKIAYLQNQYQQKDNNLENLREDFLKALEVILLQDLAPNFRATVDEQLLELVSKSYYFPKTKSVVNLLNDNNFLTIEDKKNLLSNLEKKDTANFDKLSILVSSLKLAVPSNGLAQQILTSAATNDLIKAFKFLISEKDYASLDFYINDGIRVYLGDEYLLICCLLKLAKEDFEGLSGLVTQVNQKNTSILNMRDLVDSLSHEYLKEEFSNISVWISELPFGLKCTIYAKAERYLSLIDQLHKQSEFEWLKLYDLLLLNNGFYDEVKSLYVSISDKYLEEHLGKKADEYIAKLHTRLHTISQEYLLEEILYKLNEKYSDRACMRKIYR